MRHAIFFPVARDTEVEIRIAQLGRAADRAFVQRLGFTVRIRLKSPTPRRDFLAMPGFVNHFRSEKDEIVSESGHERHAIRVRVHKKSEQQKRGRNPGHPFDFDRQNEKDVDHLVWIETGEGEKQRRDQHRVGEIAAKEKCRRSRPDRADQNIKSHPKRSPRALESFADKPKEPEDEDDPEKAEGLWNENVSNQAPDFAVTDTRWIETEHGNKIGIQAHEQEDQRAETDDDSDQAGNCEKTKSAFKFVQPVHSIAGALRTPIAKSRLAA